ncbi:MAG: ABC transporter ATP-binding protein [Nitrospiraceae bacterium]
MAMFLSNYPSQSGSGADGAQTINSMIVVEDLGFTYPGDPVEAGRWTLQNVSFRVAPGEMVGIVGPNGSGKSSLLKLLAQLLPLDRGRIAIEGRELRDWPTRELARAVAVVPQDAPPVFPFTVAEMVLMGRYPHQTVSPWSFGMAQDSADDIARAMQAMRDTGVEDLADRFVSTLSGGERQRVTIARALAQDARLLLLDEPTAFLDLRHQQEIYALVAQLRRDYRLTVLMVSHDVNAAAHYCDRLLMMRDGRLAYQGAPNELICADIMRDIYGCEVLIDVHPQTGRPRITLPDVSASFR